MEASFDKAAENYDFTFTQSEIGKMQRNLVYGELSEQLLAVDTILEINCGTGEDALWMAQKNRKVIATDISPKMIEVARHKSNLGKVDFRTVDINAIATTFQNEKFDLIFSNFGGLNCLYQSEIEQFFANADSLLSDRGKLVLVIMPKSTLWERFYFLAKAQHASAFRRKKGSILVDVSGEKVLTFYYNPKDIVHLAKQDFKLTRQKPIGFFIPPSYLEAFFSNKRKLLQLLNVLEKGISGWSFLSKYADHYIITLQKR